MKYELKIEIRHHNDCSKRFIVKKLSIDIYIHVEDIRYAVHGSNNTDSYTNNNPPHFGVKNESLRKNKDLSYAKWEVESGRQQKRRKRDIPMPINIYRFL